ncbi:hypothetical protein L1987_81478 [Smallanthus sonchifolius]|uniref:Uncharacterized protein n=1 Tax=Smallanthus sonchifolius TaxID=185202 RepID=A0ACB8YUT3_9ASTR|nr:hypothetical protein L1987_81478 [Smallanthus sonchifolius]
METTGLRNNNNKRSSQHEILQIFNRELGFNSPRNVSCRVSASEAVVKRIGLAGSDDRQVMFWNVAAKSVVRSYDSGHVNSILQARIMPFTDDRTSAADGQVRLGLVTENGLVQTKRLGEHEGRVHKLAVEPGSPYIFYSCGEDGFVQHFDLRSNTSTKLFCCCSFTGNNYVHSSLDSLALSSIIIDPRNPNYFSVGGSEEYARVYDIRKLQRAPASSNLGGPVDTFCPKHLIRTQGIITGMSYSNTIELLVSYNDEIIYLFQKDMGLGPYLVAVSEAHLDSLEEPQMQGMTSIERRHDSDDIAGDDAYELWYTLLIWFSLKLS